MNIGGRVEVTPVDFENEPWRFAREQMVLQILKDKGAPIVGTIWLRLDCKNFDWLTYEKPDGTRCFEWIKAA